MVPLREVEKPITGIHRNKRVEREEELQKKFSQLSQEEHVLKNYEANKKKVSRLKVRLPIRDTGQALKIFRTCFVLFYCSPITRKPAKSFYIYLHYNFSRVPRVGKRTFEVRLPIRAMRRATTRQKF